jgi:DNA primase small subunit
MEASREFVYQKFTDYYRDPSTIIPATTLAEQREFAYLMFKERFMVRHRRFTEFKTFRLMLAETVPSDVYHSCAYYENPDFDMDKKGWLGADLVFDIDADHIPTTCNKIHDEFRCVKCGFEGRGITPEVCPCCEATKFETKIWACDLCIQSARDETAKLLDMLENDFGFSQDELHVFFSGHRGYHVHIENDAVRSLDAMARKEIVDYVIGIGLKLFEKNEKTTSKKSKSEKGSKFRLHDFGWNKRLKMGMKAFLSNASHEDFLKIGFRDTKKLDLILENRRTLLNRCFDEGYWNGFLGVSDGTWMKLAEYIKDEQTAKIDTVVTTDIHRLIRMNGTLHGKTGLKKIEFPAKSLQDFDPFIEAVAFKKGKVKVCVSDAPEFRLSGETLGPYKNQTVELPVAAAVMLICKRRAEVAK